jgi:multiple antibiotic resistance protein
MDFFLLAFPALFAIVNPIGGAFVFLAATAGLGVVMRTHIARWVAIHSFVILNVSIYVGAYVLEFFGISLPVLRVAGGIIIALNGWKALNASEAKDDAAIDDAHVRDASRIAFYPLTMPITAGPGAISVAVALGTSRPTSPAEVAMFLIGVTGATLLISVLVYVLYRNSPRVMQLIGPTATSIIVRLSSFVLFCIGIQVLWTGVAELLTGLQGR